MGEEEKYLREAVARNGAAVFSLPFEGGLKHFKSGFGGELDDGILVEMHGAEQARMAMQAGDRFAKEFCVVAFRSAGFTRLRLPAGF